MQVKTALNKDTKFSLHAEQSVMQNFYIALC
jgi:hypothetical protein